MIVQALAISRDNRSAFFQRISACADRQWPVKSLSQHQRNPLGCAGCACQSLTFGDRVLLTARWRR